MDTVSGVNCIPADSAATAVSAFMNMGVGFSGFTLYKDGGSQVACPKTSAVGTSGNPNFDLPDVSSQFAGSCLGLYVAVAQVPGKS